MFGSTGGRKSIAPFTTTPAPALQLSQQSVQRRSSVYSAGARQSVAGSQQSNQSFFARAPVAAGVPKDPRPLKDRVYQGQIGQELLDFMVQNNFEMEMKHSLTTKSVLSPTQKDFNFMFQWLYNKIDPSYRFLKAIDAEVPPILKMLGYPYEKSITRSQLSAVGGPNWSLFLGMLHWLLQLVIQMENYGIGKYDDACEEAGIEVYQDRVRFEFISDAYRTWLSMDDDQDDDQAEALLKPHVDAMIAKLDQANSRYLEDVEKLEKEQRELQDQIDALSKSSSKLSKLDEQIKILEEDTVKFENYNKSIEAKAERHEVRCSETVKVVEATKLQVKTAEEERAHLQKLVDAQGIPLQEIDRMNTERERLQKGLENTAQRLEESRSKVAEKVSHASAKLEGLERIVQEYNSLGYQIGIIPSTAQLADGQDFELHLKVNEAPDFRASRTKRPESPEPDRLLADPTSGYQPQHLLNLDVKGHVKNGIMGLRKIVSERKNAAVDEDMEKKDLLDKIRDAMEEKQQQLEGLGHHLRAAEEEFDRTKEVSFAQCPPEHRR
jgi:kinetochore protein NDC80